MADYNLATQKAARAGSTGGLRPQAIRAGGGAQISAGRIAQGAGQIQFTPSNVPKPVRDQTSENIQAFMGATAEAAFKYQDRESTYFANEEILAAGKSMDDLLNGSLDSNGNFTPGFLAKEGGNATKGYGEFAQKLDEIASSRLEAMEPRVREKAAMRIIAAKDTARTTGAKHRAKQFEVAEKALQYQQVKQLGALATKDYRRLFTPDQFGKTIKDRIYNDIFSDPVEADKAWYEMLVGTVKGIVNDAPNIQQGIVVASKLLDDFVGPELAGDPTTLNALKSYLDGQDRQDQRFQFFLQDRAEADQKKVDQTRYKNNEVAIYKATQENGPMSQADLLEAYSSDEVSEGFYNAYKNEFQRGAFIQDQDYYLKLVQRMKGGEKGLFAEISGSQRLDASHKSMLFALGEDLTNPNFAGRMDRLLGLAAKASQRGSDFEVFGTDRKANWETNYTDDIYRWIKEDRTDEQIEKLIEANYSFSQLTRAEMIPLTAMTSSGNWESMYPETQEEINEAQRRVDAMPETVEGEGAFMSPSDKSKFTETAEKWRGILEASGIPRTPEEVSENLVDEVLAGMDEQDTPEQRTRDELIKTVTEDNKELLKGLDEDTKRSVIETKVELELARQNRNFELAAIRQDRREKLVRDSLAGTDIGEAEAVLDAGVQGSRETKRFLTKYRRARLARIQTNLVQSRTDLRRAKEIGSPSEVESAAETVAVLTRAKQSEVNRQRNIDRTSTKRSIDNSTELGKKRIKDTADAAREDYQTKGETAFKADYSSALQRLDKQVLDAQTSGASKEKIDALVEDADLIRWFIQTIIPKLGEE